MDSTHISSVRNPMSSRAKLAENEILSILWIPIIPNWCVYIYISDMCVCTVCTHTNTHTYIYIYSIYHVVHRYIILILMCIYIYNDIISGDSKESTRARPGFTLALAPVTRSLQTFSNAFTSEAHHD